MSDCIFCKIIKKEVPADFVFENDKVVVFKDIHPSAPIHLLIVPKVSLSAVKNERHLNSINDLEEEDKGVISEIFLIAKKMAKDFNFDKNGYKLVFNVGRGGGQVIDHLHLHLLGGWKEGEIRHLP